VLIAKVLFGFAVLLALFRLAFLFFGQYSAAFSLALFVFISFYAVASVGLFWATCNDSFSEEESRSVYGFIGAGGILGGLAGGLVSQHLVPFVGTENLLLLSAGILLCTLPFPFLIIGGFHGQPCLLQINESLKQSMAHNGLRLIGKHPYVRAIALLVFFTTLVATLFDFQFQTIIKSAELPKDLRTALFARIFTYINLGGIAIHLLLTPQVLKRWGPVAGLWPLPILAVLAVFVLKILPGLPGVMLVWPLWGAVSYSLQQVSKESLYVPATRGVKYVSKAYIDTFVYRAGDTVASVIIMMHTYLSAQGAPRLLMYNLSLALVWLWFIFNLRRYLAQHRGVISS
jgi:AAA family ATP:ADP antiporter